MEIDTNNLHHAYLLLGEEKEAANIIGSLFIKLGINPLGNPDVHIYRDKTFGIDEARILKQRAEAKSFGNKKFFIIYSSQITGEAQNALLKVFEEPTEGTHFIIISLKNIFLPTLLSRMKVVRLKTLLTDHKEAKVFLNNNVPGRLALIKETLSDEDFNLSSFLDDLLKELSENKNILECRKVFEVAKFASDRAANSRLILEHLALTLPERLK